MSILMYNGNKITQRDIDGYVNATEMCQANGKKISHWLATKETQAYVEAISSVTGIPASQLVFTKKR